MSTPRDNNMPPPPPGAGHGANGLPAEEKTWGMLAHLSSLLGALVTSALGGGWGCFIGPLIVWLVKKDTMPFVDDQGKESLNFNITVGIASLVLFVLVVMTLGIGILIAAPLWAILWIYWLVCTIIASIRANEGVAYRYPLTLRLIK